MRIVVDENNIDEVKMISDIACKRALEKWGQSYENHAKSYAPVDTGRLRNSIEHHAEGDDTMVVQTDVEYAVYQELGTSKQSGTPYMRPAGNNHLAEYKTIIETELK